MAEIRILHATESLAFACRIAGVLAADGYSVIRVEAGGPPRRRAAPDALVVVWSPQMFAIESALQEARAAVADRRMVPVAIGRIEPPPSFAHLPPIDLAGWEGEREDSRWRFALEEIDLAIRRPKTIGPDLFDDAELRADPSHLGDATPFPVRAVVAGAGGLALLAIVAVVVAPLVGFGGKAPPRAAPPRVAVDLGERVISKPALPEERPATERLAIEDGAVPAPTVSRLPAEPAAQSASTERASDVASNEAVEAEFENLKIESGVRESPYADGPASSLVEEDAAAPATTVETESGLRAVSASPIVATADVGAETTDVVDATPLEPPAVRLPPRPADDFLGVVFRDCIDCPDMAEIPGGVFLMGADATDAERIESEGPVSTVTIRRFALSRREVTFAEWRICVDEGGCARNPDDAGFGRGARPVINVSYDDAKQFVGWLAQKTGQPYRLPTEAEWEYAARAGAPTPYAYGVALSPTLANYSGALVSETGAPVDVRMSVPVASYPANSFGLYDVHGNVWEWVEDCWTPTHAGAPADGSARVWGCNERVVKGGAYDTTPTRLRAAHRIGHDQSARDRSIGFRVARDLD